MSNFVIDENVVRNAWHGKKSNGSDAYAEMKFTADILYGNYGISVSKKIRDKFSKFKDDNFGKHKYVNDLILSSYVKLLFNSTRTQMHTPIKTDFKGVKDCDNEFVGVAMNSQALLVSEDDKLKQEIAKDPTVKNCRCEAVEDVIGTY